MAGAPIPPVPNDQRAPTDEELIDPLLRADPPRPAAPAADHHGSPRVVAGWAGRHPVLVLLVVLGVMLVAADRLWAHDDRVARNVRLAGRPVAELDREALDRYIDELAVTFQATPVIIRSEAGAVTTTAAELGVSVDIAATTAAVWDANRPGAPLVGWLIAEAGASDLPVALSTSQWRGEQVLGTGPVAADAQLAVRDGELVALEGTPALGLDTNLVRQRLEDATWRGGPVDLTVPAARAEPARTAAQVEALADRLNTATATPLAVRSGDDTVTVPPAQLRGWVRLSPSAEGFTLDSATVTADLGAAFAPYRTPAVDARFEVVGGTPSIVDGTPALWCCDTSAVAPLVAALATGPPPAPVAVPVVSEPPATTTADLEALGVREPVGSFTTTFRCCEPRVNNITRMAELLNGQVIGPAELFSVNDRIGRRTVESGFVVAPAIIGGEIGEELGGGISQVMTTLFNAAFFAGLDYGQYQSHSLYFSRYPYGREATINWPKPDLQLRNITPHGVLIWTEVTDRSITVTLYSTRVYASVEQTGQTEGPAGVSCTLVRTERTRVGLDGRVTVDEVRALYRREAGLDCDQTEVTTTTAEPLLEITAPPSSPPPTSAAPGDHPHDDSVPSTTAPPATTGGEPSSSAPSPGG